MSNHSKYPKEAGIYKLTCNNNGKVYIGKSVNIRRRLSYHKICGKTLIHKCYFQNAILKHGWESFTVEILETVENFDKVNDNQKLLDREAYYIELFDSCNKDKGYNIRKYSTDSTGTPLSEEHKEKVRQALLGKSHTKERREKMRQSKLGTSHSKETKEKISQSKLGKLKSDATKEKMRICNSRPRKPMSEEHKEKIRQANLGRVFSEEHKEKLKQAKQKNDTTI